MSFQLCGPSLMLFPYVKHYWGLENCLDGGNTHTQRVVPTGLVELSFYLSDRPKLFSNKSDLSHGVLVTGQQSEPYDIVVGGHLCLFSIAFKPLGAMMFLNLPLGELKGMTIPLSYLNAHDTGQLEVELAGSDSFEQRVDVVEGFLIRVFQRNQRSYANVAIGDSIAAIDRAGGAVRIQTLASRASLCRKQYERVFLDNVGVTPKSFLRIVRFQHAIHKAQACPENLHLTGLAHDCGYYDQSHMINEFRLLSGMTPKQYFARCAPFSDYFC